ncbi:MAG: hypothetical protein L6R37_001583 [Teloschistes peruensis]|nr:MAG: hypothetical protein L6R37_001583 [Teloschistes peruensis]
MDFIHDRAARAVSEQMPRKSGESTKPTVAPASKVSLQAPSAPRGMGARETQLFIDKLIKENWSLKLDITLQRKAEEKLRAKAEKAEALEKRVQKLEKANQDLAQQLGQRDNALQEAFDVILKSDTDKSSLQQTQAQSKTLLLKLAALSNADNAAATPAQKVSYTDEWVFSDTPSPRKSAKPINALKGSTLSLATTESFDDSQAEVDDYSDRMIGEMSLCSEFDSTREYELEAMGYVSSAPLLEAFDVIYKLDTDRSSSLQAQSKTLLLISAVLSNTNSAAAATTKHIRTPAQKVFENTPSPTQSAEPTINLLEGSALSLGTNNSFETSKAWSDDYSDRLIEDMSLVSEFDPTREYDLEAVGRPSLFFTAQSSWPADTRYFAIAYTERSSQHAKSKTLLLKLAALSNTDNAAATPAQKASTYTYDGVLENTLLPKKLAKPINALLKGTMGRFSTPLVKVNKHLAEELKKRDLALQEAFDVIYELDTDKSSSQQAQTPSSAIPPAEKAYTDD